MKLFITCAFLLTTTVTTSVYAKDCGTYDKKSENTSNYESKERIKNSKDQIEQKKQSLNVISNIKKYDRK